MSDGIIVDGKIQCGFPERGKPIRKFETGATRDTVEGKLDYEGFLSPLVLECYAQYLHKHRTQSDGKLRDSDNWQRGIPKEVYIKSGFRHFIDVWKQHRGFESQNVLEDSLMAVLFNIMGYAFEVLKEKECYQQKNKKITQKNIT